MDISDFVYAAVMVGFLPAYLLALVLWDWARGTHCPVGEDARVLLEALRHEEHWHNLTPYTLRTDPLDQPIYVSHSWDLFKVSFGKEDVTDRFNRLERRLIRHAARDLARRIEDRKSTLALGRFRELYGRGE